MKNSTVVCILKTLNTRERTKFKEFVHSPYFNKNKTLCALCDYLLDLAPKFDDKNKTSKQHLHKVVFENKTYDEYRLNNIVSDLLQLLYSYLSLSNIKKQPSTKQIYLLETLQQRGLEKPFEKVSKRYHKQEKNKEVQDSKFFLQQLQFYTQQDFQFHSKKSRVFDQNLQQKNNFLDLYYLSSKLKVACDMTSRNIVINADYNSTYLEELLGWIKNDIAHFRKIPAVFVYYKILLTLRDSEEEQHYFDLKAMLADNLNTFHQKELRLLFDYLQNYCIRKINIGQTPYYKELLDSYKLTLANEIVLDNGQLSEWDYKNIVTVGLRLEDNDWVQNFIHDYKERVPKNVRDNAFLYNLASYYYVTKDYKKALRQLLNVEFTDTSYHLGAKTIQLKSYFELDEQEAFLALCDAFSNYLRRSKQISEYRKKANLNLIRISKKLMNLKHSKELIKDAQYQKKRAASRKSLQTITPIANIDWLNKMISTL